MSTACFRMAGRMARVVAQPAVVLGARAYATRENRTKSAVRRTVNWNSRRSMPLRLRYTAESPPKVPDRPVPRDWRRIAAIRARLTMIWPAARNGFTNSGPPVVGGRMVAQGTLLLD